MIKIDAKTNEEYIDCRVMDNTIDCKRHSVALVVTHEKRTFFSSRIPIEWICGKLDHILMTNKP
ncbi:hypothetical protein BLOT_016739 [Blomia tropicalis]|nr:hypothetical protein BLOT_016739 [Blomia tropicalis]